MALPKKYYSIAELAKRWDEANTDVVHCLITGMLKASIKLKPTDLKRVFVDKDGEETFKYSYGEKGYFEIHPYENIVWRESDNNYFGVCCDFVSKKVRLFRDDIMYSFTEGDFEDVGPSCADRIIRYSDIIIMLEEVKRFELENGMITIPSTEVITQADSYILPGLQNSDNKNDINTYIAQNINTPLKEKVRWLRENARKNNVDIGGLLNIGTEDPKSSGSRKQKVQAIYKSNFDDETWKEMHPEKKKRK